MSILSHIRERFAEIVLCDTEYTRPDGGLPELICVVFHLVKSGCTLRFWADGLVKGSPPLQVGTEDVFVCYNATAELMNYVVQGWAIPQYVLDLFPIHRHFQSAPPAPPVSSVAKPDPTFGKWCGTRRASSMRRPSNRARVLITCLQQEPSPTSLVPGY